MCPIHGIGCHSIEIRGFERFWLGFANTAKHSVFYNQSFGHLFGLAGVDGDDEVHGLQVIFADCAPTESADSHRCFPTDNAVQEAPL